MGDNTRLYEIMTKNAGLRAEWRALVSENGLIDEISVYWTNKHKYNKARIKRLIREIDDVRDEFNKELVKTAENGQNTNLLRKIFRQEIPLVGLPEVQGFGDAQ